MAYDRQIETVHNLRIVDRCYELRTYEVDQVTKDTLSVARTYSQPGMRVEWHELVFVGPRGGCKTIYKNFY